MAFDSNLTITELRANLWGITNLGPLPTTFTPPTSCLQDYYYTLDGTSTIGTNPDLAWGTKSECYPPGYQSAYSSISSLITSFTSFLWVEFGGYYSPGVCPSGYITACTEHEDLIQANQSAFVCCPSGYTCWDFATNRPMPQTHRYPSANCWSPINAPITATDAKPSGTGVTTITIYPTTSLTMFSAEINITNSILAPPVRIRWKVSDLTTIDTAPPARTARLPEDVDPPAGTAGLPKDVVPPASAGGLPNSAKIALGVTIPATVTAIAIYLLKYHWRKRLLSEQDGPQVDPEGATMHELKTGHNTHELDASLGIVPESVWSMPEADSRPLPAWVEGAAAMVEADSRPLPAGAPGVGVMPEEDSRQLRAEEPGAILPVWPVSQTQDWSGLPAGVLPVAELGGMNRPVVPHRVPIPERNSVTELDRTPATPGPHLPGLSYSADLGVMEDEELEWLKREKEKLNERRERLRKMEELDEEERRLDQRIRERIAGREE